MFMYCILLYTRLYGSYESLSYGLQSEALQEFTGGVIEKIKLSNPPDNLFAFLNKAVERHSLMGASIVVSY
jgi:calpain